MTYRAMVLSLSVSALTALSVAVPAQAGDFSQPVQACGGGGHGVPGVFNVDRSVTINRNFDYSRNFEINKNFDFSKNIEINKNFDFSKNIEINKSFGIM